MESILSSIYKKYEHLANKLHLPDKNLSVIKSNLLHSLKEITEEQQGILPSHLTNGTTCCKWCFNNWTHGKFTTRLLPEKRQKACLRRLLKKKVSSLNAFQRRLVRKCKQNNGNKLIFLCHMCNKNTITYLKKPREENPKLNEEVSNKSKTKKNKKDVYAGLKPTAVHKFSSSVKLPNNIVKSNNIKKKKTKKAKKNKTEGKMNKIVKNKSTASLLLSLLDPL